MYGVRERERERLSRISRVRKIEWKIDPVPTLESNKLSSSEYKFELERIRVWKHLRLAQLSSRTNLDELDLKQLAQSDGFLFRSCVVQLFSLFHFICFKNVLWEWILWILKCRCKVCFLKWVQMDLIDDRKCLPSDFFID